MGHYEAVQSSGSATSTQPHAKVYESFRKQCSGNLTNIDLHVTIAIREFHPDSHVTCVHARKCDLEGFSKAGRLTTKLNTEYDNFVASRSYSPPATRMEGGSGKLEDQVSFGYYDAEYAGEKFNFYIVAWRDEFFGRPTKNYYILSPKASLDSTNHSPFVDRLLLTAGKWTHELHDELYVFDSGCWDKNKNLWKAVQSSTWYDVILDPVMKETLISDVQKFFDSRDVYEEYAVPWKRGIIFHGTPGCGKTISIKALMNALDKRESSVASLYVKSFKACEGEEYSIREIFMKAREMAPCMLVFEDLDSLVEDKLRSYFLNEVDGLEDNNGILMIGSTNHLERLDPGISKRPSRFDRKYHFKIPAQKERILYCQYWKKKLQKNSNVDFDPEICDVVAKLTDGFSFAYMKELFVQTLLTIVGGRNDDVDEAEVEDAADDAVVVPDSAKLVGEGEKVESTAESGAAKSGSSDADAAPKIEDPAGNQRQMPQVEIPPRLASNPLMRILRKQAITLWKDMDNTKDPEAGEKKVSSASEGEGAPETDASS